MSRVWRRRDLYDLLEVERTANDSDLVRAWHIQRTVWSPDRFKDPSLRQEAEERVQAVEAAFEKLSQPRERALYDATLRKIHTSQEQFELYEQNDPSSWKQVAKWMKEKNVGKPFNRKLAYDVGCYLENGWELSAKQVKYALKSWELAVENGFVPDVDFPF